MSMKALSYVEIITFPLEFSRGIDSVSHDPGDRLFNIFHPFCHLGVSHIIDLLDEGVIFLPKSHLGNLCELRPIKERLIVVVN